MFDYLPSEVLAHVFSYLSVGDLKVASLVCSKWRFSASLLLRKLVAVMPLEDVSSVLSVFKDSSVKYKHWVFKDVDLSMKNFHSDFWSEKASDVISLSLIDVDMPESTLLNMLKSCSNLEHLCLAGFQHMFMTGKVLFKSSDLEALKVSLAKVKVLRMSCSRYLTDDIFHRLVSTVGSLRELCLSSCQIAFQASIRKRFYPKDGSVEASDMVFTFKTVLACIENNKSTIKSLGFDSTGIDSQSLGTLSQVPDLHLQTLSLRSCAQLTINGIQVLTESQKSLTELDVSFCSRVTDHALIAISTNLPLLKKLRIRRCQSVTEAGLVYLRGLRLLEELDISYLELRYWEQDNHDALVGFQRPTMKVLSLASLPITKDTIAYIPSSMPNLLHLDLTMCMAGTVDESLQSICKGLPKLRVLLMGDCSLISDVGLTGIPMKEPLSADVTKAGHPPSDGTLEQDLCKVPLGSKAEIAIRKQLKIRKYPSTEESNARFNAESQQGLSAIRGLRELNLCGCDRISDFSLKLCFKFRELRSLNLSHCQLVTSDGLVEMFKECPAIEVLHLVGCSSASDHVVEVMSQTLKRLFSLDVQNCYHLTDKSLESISRGMINLRYLNVSGCRRMSPFGVRVLQERLPRLFDLHFVGLE